MYNLTFMQMKQVPASWSDRLRELSYGYEEGTMWRWTFQQGKCYAAILRNDQDIIAWSCCTFSDDWYPVVGCFVDEEHRRKGLGSLVARYMLEQLELEPATPVYAVARLWPSWPDLLREFGLVYFDWPQGS